MDSIHKAYNKIINDMESLSEGFLTDVKNKLTSSSSTKPKSQVTISLNDLHSSADHITPEHLHKILDGGYHHSFREAAMHHDKIDASHITKALNDPEPIVRESAMRENSHKLTVKHIAKALEDPNWSIRDKAVSHKLCSQAQRQHAYENDPNPNVRSHAGQPRFYR